MSGESAGQSFDRHGVVVDLHNRRRVSGQVGGSCVCAQPDGVAGLDSGQRPCARRELDRPLTIAGMVKNPVEVFVEFAAADADKTCDKSVLMAVVVGWWR